MRLNGFTLIELMIVIAILGILTAIIAPVLMGSSPISVETQAREFLQRKEISFSNLSCVSRDTDNNGYLSCTYTALGNGSPKLEQIECSVYRNVGECKLSTPRVWRGE